MSKQQMLAGMENEEAMKVSRVFHRWICIYGMMDILQSDKGSEFKGVYCNDLVMGSTHVTSSGPVASTPVSPPVLPPTTLPCHSWYYVQALCHLPRYYI